MKFYNIPKFKASEEFGFIEFEDRFYSFIEELGIVSVRWSQPTTLSAQYFFRLLTKGSSARARGFTYHSNDENSNELYPFCNALLDHSALWKLSSGQVICTSMPYGGKKEILEKFQELLKRFEYPRTINLDFLDEKYKYRKSGDFMIAIYNSELYVDFDSNNSFDEIGINDEQNSSKYKHEICSYIRNKYVSEYAKRRAGGICQLCEQPAPFIDRNGEPYLETHHIVWLGDGGSDTVDNVVALCPNCHRRMHSLNLQEDIEILFKRI